MKQGPEIVRGFTLLELLLALVLSAMLLTVLSAGSYTIVSDWQRDGSSLDEELNQTLSLVQLERALSAASPERYFDREISSFQPVFQGDSSTLIFASTVAPTVRQGMSIWHLSNSESGVELRLVSAMASNPTSRIDSAPTITLLPNYDLRIRYLQQSQFDSVSWTDLWQGSDKALPIAIELSYLPRQQDENHPRLVQLVPIKVSTEDSSGLLIGVQ